MNLHHFLSCYCYFFNFVWIPCFPQIRFSDYSFSDFCKLCNIHHISHVDFNRCICYPLFQCYPLYQLLHNTEKYWSKGIMGLYVSIFFSIWVFFHEHLRFTGQQGKGEAISLSPLYQFHPLHRHVDISRAITAEGSPLHKTSRRTRTRNLLIPSASR